jgi:hypothetical protein
MRKLYNTAHYWTPHCYHQRLDLAVSPRLISEWDIQIRSLDDLQRSCDRTSLGADTALYETS